MTPETEALVIDLVFWLAERSRPYQEVMDAWRTSCSRLPVWEEANDCRFVVHRGGMVYATEAGHALLAAHDRRVFALA